MATKGVRASLEPVCFRLFGQGWTLSSLSDRFDVSVTTLSRWKKESHRPGKDNDDWDLARQTHVTRGENLQKIFEEQEEYTLGLNVSERDTRVHDALSKASANFRHWEDHQKAATAALLAETESSGVSVEIDKPAIFLETLEWIAIKLKDTDPEGLKILARNYDTLLIQFKSEQAKQEQ